jgi:hypothetical protein
MLTTAGLTRLSMGASEGTGVSPTTVGNCAPATEVHAASTKAARLNLSFI